MARWEPGADGRLREAALALFLERGYEQTTVAEIAQRAGVTARTYFRHFADKREVLFSGAEGVRAGMAEAMAGAPADATPVAVAGLALDAAAEAIGHRRDFYRQRQVVVDANVELQERELMKLADLADVLAAGLRERDVPDAEARLVAEAAITVLGRGLPPLGRLARRHGRPRGDPARGPRRAARPTARPGMTPAQRLAPSADEVRALEAIDEAAIVAELQELVAIPSVSGSDAESDIQHVLAERLRAADLDVDLWALDLPRLQARPDFPGCEVERPEAWGLVAETRRRRPRARTPGARRRRTARQPARLADGPLPGRGRRVTASEAEVPAT